MRLFIALDLADDVREAVSLYAAEVREGRYPGPEHSFGK